MTNKGSPALGVVFFHYVLTGSRSSDWHQAYVSAHVNRLDSRLNEHQNSGKKFDHCIYDDPKPRSTAQLLEKKRIRRDQTKYNIHHR